MDNLTAATSMFAVLMTVLGLYFAVRNWFFWTRGDIKNLRARVFLDETFLTRNFNLVLLIGGVLGLHVVLLLAEALEIPGSTYLSILNYLLMDAAMLLMVLLAILWFRFLSKGDIDSHGINQG